jgi:drug/metabolite transporter (DMT)-like permease
MIPALKGAALVRIPRTLFIRIIGAVGVLCISFSAIFFREAGVAPATATFFRALYAVPLLGLIWLAIRRRDTRPPGARVLAFASGVLLALDLTLWHRTVELIGAGLGTVLGNSQVIFVGLAAWFVWKEKPSRIAVWSLPAMVLGVALLSGLGRDDAYGEDPLRGVLFGVMTGVAYAGFLIVFRASNRRHLVPTPGPLLDATLGAVVGGLIAGMLASDFSFEPSWPAHGWLLAMALLIQVMGWLLISFALPRLAALETSLLLLIQPVAALLWARLIFSETLSPIQGAGVVIVLAGIVTLSLRGTVESEDRTATLATTPADSGLHPEPPSP